MVVSLSRESRHSRPQVMACALQGLALALALVSHQGAAYASLAVPGFDSDQFKYDGTECIHGALPGRGPRPASSTSTTSNSRTTHFALPSGVPPANGWPVYLYFPPWAVPGNQSGPCDQNTIPPPLSPACKALLANLCPASAARSGGGCEPCVHAAEAAHADAWAAAHCPLAGSVGREAAPWMWCRNHGNYPLDPVFVKYTAFDSRWFGRSSHMFCCMG